MQISARPPQSKLPPTMPPLEDLGVREQQAAGVTIAHVHGGSAFLQGVNRRGGPFVTVLLADFTISHHLR